MLLKLVMGNEERESGNKCTADPPENSKWRTRKNKGLKRHNLVKCEEVLRL